MVGGVSDENTKKHTELSYGSLLSQLGPIQLQLLAYVSEHDSNLKRMQELEKFYVIDRVVYEMKRSVPVARFEPAKPSLSLSVK